MSDDDAKLVQATLSGNRQAFDKLVVRYQRRAVAVTARLLGNIDDALEVAQNGFLKAYQALAQLKEPEKFGSWLMRIMTNQALNYRRSRSRNRTIRLEENTGDGDDKQQMISDPALTSKEPLAFEQLAASETAQALQEAIDDLPENLRKALLLFAVEKLPQKEIADIMQCSLQTVKWNVFEARRRLKGRLEINKEFNRDET